LLIRVILISVILYY